jgi:ferric-dicitrate binding protein FerR (iron transport regulator)
MTRKDFQELLKKVNTGKASPEEEKVLFDWYAAFEQEALPEDGVLTETEQEELLADLRSKTSSTRPSNQGLNIIYKIAASIFFGGCLLLSWYFYQNHQTKEELSYSIVPKGERRKLILSDSTVVWLNADSKLSYPEHFGNHSRDITLSGEAYFEVKHDASRPFTVHTRNIDIRVLGTVFDVKAYPHDQKVETSLIHGLVRVTIHNGKKSGQQVILHPNQKFVLPNSPEADGGQANFAVEPQKMVMEAPGLQLAKETGWRNNSLSFENEQFSELVPRLERWFDIKVVVQKPEMNNLRFTGTLDNASLETVMQALMLSAHFNYRKEGDHTIVIY